MIVETKAHGLDMENGRICYRGGDVRTPYWDAYGVREGRGSVSGSEWGEKMNGMERDGSSCLVLGWCRRMYR